MPELCDFLIYFTSVIFGTYGFSALEMFRLKMILRLLQMSSFNGKMSALNEINQLISTMSQQPKPEWLTPAVITVSIFFLKVIISNSFGNITFL